MKKIKLFLCVALFGAMSFGAFTAYDYVTMSDDEKFLLENIEALTSIEGGGAYEKVGCVATICKKYCLGTDGVNYPWASKEKCYCTLCK